MEAVAADDVDARQNVAGDDAYRDDVAAVAAGNADACPNVAAEAEEVAADDVDDSLNPSFEVYHCLNLRLLPPLQYRNSQIRTPRKLKVSQILLPSFSFC